MEFIREHLTKIILILGASGALVFIIKNFARIKKFLLEVKAELSKVSWSTREELAGSTFVVIAITFMLTLFIGAVDLLLSKILSVIFR